MDAVSVIARLLRLDFTIAIIVAWNAPEIFRAKTSIKAIILNVRLFIIKKNH